MSMVYSWRDGSRMTIDAEAAAERLNQIAAKNGGELTADIVLAEAEKKRSPLHGAFEWDDTKAAREFRLEQARHLVHSLDVEIVDETGESESVEVRAFMQTEAKVLPGRMVYARIEDIMSDTDRRESLVERALAELDSWRRRTANLKELAKIHRAIDLAKEPKRGTGVLRKVT